MPIPASIADLSPTAASNSPLGSEPPTEGDNHIRALAAIVRQVYDDQNDSTDVAAGDALVAVKQPFTGSVARTQHAKNAEFVSVLDFIPVAEHAAIAAHTSTYDASAAINAAIAAWPDVYVPPGRYRHTLPINLSARRQASQYWGRHLRGAGATHTIFESVTGNYPCVDACGMNRGRIEGITFASDSTPSGFAAADLASIGLYMGRGTVSPQCNLMILEDVQFLLMSDMARNAGTGTVGICNEGSEHIVTNAVHIYANLPLVSHHVLQFAISQAGAISSEYEVRSGAAISCTIHEWRNMVLVAWDSFRAVWFSQVANVEMPVLYTSTRKLVAAVPAYDETFYIQDSANIKIDCYQETSGLFGATYRMDHRYITLAGINESWDITVRRGVADYLFTNPGVSEPSIHILNGGYLSNSRVDCNYLIGMYNASGDNNGFPNSPVTFAGTPNALVNVDLTLDHGGSHSAGIFATLGPYCKNVMSVNYLTGERRRSDGGITATNNVFTPVAIGLATAGTGTYVGSPTGFFERSGGWYHFSLQIAWSAHTGTGQLAISGMPFTSEINVEQACSVMSDALVIGAGKQLTARTTANSTRIALFVSDLAGGAEAGVAVDGTVTKLILSGSIKIAD